MRKAFEVIFDDEYLIVLNKTAKILVQPSPRKEKHTLTSLLEKQLQGGVFPCHRLDRQTTGLIIYAKDKGIQREIMEEFRTGKIKKKYIAFVGGNLKRKEGVWEGSIIDREGGRFGEKLKEAKTEYRVLKEFKDWSVLEFKPLTGRTNQLRIQCVQIGHCILGDRKYGLARNFKVKFKRLALHAYFLSFIHPVSGERVNLEIDLPPDMKDFLRHGYTRLPASGGD